MKAGKKSEACPEGVTQWSPSGAEILPGRAVATTGGRRKYSEFEKAAPNCFGAAKKPTSKGGLSVNLKGLVKNITQY